MSWLWPITAEIVRYGLQWNRNASIEVLGRRDRAPHRPGRRVVPDVVLHSPLFMSGAARSMYWMR